MKSLFIICQRYFGEDFSAATIGGIQTYITNLCQVGNQLGFQCTVIQYDHTNREKEFPYGKVIGVDISNCKRLRHKNKALFKKFQKLYNSDTDLLIYATEGMAQKESKDYAIAIQHGIRWDIKSDNEVSRLSNIAMIFSQALESVLTTQCAYNVKRLVCVDHNFPNWYRTQVRHPETEITVVPNFTAIAPEQMEKHQEETIKILFARRFQPYRGTRLFANVMSRLLEEYPNVSVTLAGNGPDEQWLRDKFADSERVSFTQYSSEESLQFHKDYHIAVVPTVGSEGTSLSLLEAMSAQCAVVCTNVGGMTNIVIDNYNGLIVNPDEKSLYAAIKRLITDREFRVCLAAKGYDTVQQGFSRELWVARWVSILQELDPQRAK